MTSPRIDEEFARELEIFPEEAEAGAQCFYSYLAVHELAKRPGMDLFMRLERQWLIVVFALCIQPSSGQQISAITDAASFQKRIAPGTLATVFGSDLATKPANAPSLPLPTTLGDTQLLLDCAYRKPHRHVNSTSSEVCRNIAIHGTRPILDHGDNARNLM
jgi:hypothetical protein